MWIATRDGFYSAVQSNTDPETLVVRSRVKADARYLAEFVWCRRANRPRKADALIVSYDFSDYPWRVLVSRAEWADFLVQASEEITYGNFKNAVHANDHKRAGIYGGVWQELLRLQSTDPERKVHRRQPDEYPWPDEDYYTPGPDVWPYTDEPKPRRRRKGGRKGR